MRIINNTKDESITKENPKFPMRVICEHCESEIEVDEKDVKIGEFGLYKFTCPVCGKESFVDDEGLTLTTENLKFPDHYHSSFNGVNISNEEIDKMVKDCIKRLRETNDKTVYSTFTECGNTYVAVNRYDGDQVFNVVVSKDYYETDVPFTEEDKMKFPNDED
jgi:DNA-directed RNA polymerase subunit M/transcription elongation factor TFIIS